MLTGLAAAPFQPVLGTIVLSYLTEDPFVPIELKTQKHKRLVPRLSRSKRFLFLLFIHGSSIRTQELLFRGPSNIEQFYKLEIK